MDKDKEFLGTEKIGKLLFRLAVPTVIAQIVNMLYNIVDRIYIGHIPGEGSAALTGVGVCMPIIMIISAFAALVSAGGAPRASISLGKGDKDGAEKNTRRLFLTSAYIIGRADCRFAYMGQKASADVRRERKYNRLRYGLYGYLCRRNDFCSAYIGLKRVYNGSGFCKTGMLTVIIGAAANIVLDPLFIFVFNMGVRGAAVATVISQGVSCVWAVCFLLSKKTGLKIRLKNMRLSLKIIMPCIALGLATFIMQASESVISVCFNSSLLKYGGDIAVGAMTILTSVMQFAMLPLQGIGQGAQPIMSYNYGARNPDRVKKTYRLLLIVNMIYAVILWAAIMLFPKAFAGIFSSDSELVGFAAKALRIYLGGMFLMGAQIACQMAFVSIGNAPCSIIVAVVRKFVLLIPLIYIMPHIISDKAIGVYTAEPIADVLAVTFTLILFAFKFRSAMKKLEKPEAAEK